MNIFAGVFIVVGLASLVMFAMNGLRYHGTLFYDGFGPILLGHMGIAVVTSLVLAPGIAFIQKRKRDNQ